MLYLVQSDDDSYKQSWRNNLVFLLYSDHLLILHSIIYKTNAFKNLDSSKMSYRFNRTLFFVELIATNARVCSCGDTAIL